MSSTTEYTEVAAGLPDQHRLVRVIPPGSSLCFYATRNGRKWEIIRWRGEEWLVFQARIRNNEFWSYMQKGIEK